MMIRMRDLDLAKKTLGSKNVSIVIVKKGKILFESSMSGINPILQAIEKLKHKMSGSSVADKIVGRSAALLLVYSHVNEVFASVLSIEGRKVLEENGVKYEFSSIVQKILDKTGKNTCPFESFSYNITSPNQAYKLMKVFAKTCNEKTD